MPSQSLEQEALDRVARMYSSFDRRAFPRPQPPKPPEPEPEPQPQPEPEPQPLPVEKPPAGLPELLLKDKEQSLLLLLLIILMRDGADLNAVLALMYLLI